MEQEEPLREFFRLQTKTKTEDYKIIIEGQGAHWAQNSKRKKMYEAEEHLDLLEDQIKDTYQTLVSSIKKMRTLKK